MKKLLSVLLALGLCASAMTGCNTGDNPSKVSSTAAVFSPSMDTSAAASIRVVGSVSNFEALEAVVQDFQKIYPNVQVNYSKVDNYSTSIASVALGNDPPEIYMSFHSFFETNSALTDATLDMSEMNLDTGILFPGILGGCYYNNMLMRIPLALNYQGIAVNTSLLAKEGLAIPATYDDFIRTCDKLLADGYTPLQGYPDLIYGNLLFNEWRYRIANDENSSALIEALNTGADGCGEPLRKSYAILDDYRMKGYFNDSVNSAISDNYEAAILSFFEGKTPFLVCNAETVSGMEKRQTKSAAFTANPFEYTFCELPVSDIGITAAVDVWNGFSIVKNSKEEKWAEEFIRFLFTPEELNTMAQVKGMPTVVANGSNDARYENLSSLSETQKVYIGNLSIANAPATVFSAVAKKVCTGEYSVDQAVALYPETVREKLNSK